MRSVTARPATANNYGIDKEHTSWRVDLHRSPLQPRTALTRVTVLLRTYVKELVLYFSEVYTPLNDQVSLRGSN
ncbi:hypothetical protein J6590_099506 [Homalodisca vitripennis]|nr:hypothetical protein J6590_099506 [Homalodisca vitripennis]